MTFLAALMMTGALAYGADATPPFLVATRQMGDPIFQESVILMLPPSGEIPLVVGLIINKPTSVRAHQLFPDAPGFKSRADMVYFGGPVEVTEPSVVLRAAKPSDTAIRLFEDIYVSTDPDSVAKLIKEPAPAKDLRLIVGRAQWSRNQLHAEILEGSWYVMPAEAGLVFSDPAGLWRALVHRGELQQANATRWRGPGIFPVGDAILDDAVSGWRDLGFVREGETPFLAPDGSR